MECLGSRLALMYFSIILSTFPLAIVAVFSGPENTSVLQGNTATLNCRDPAYTGPGVTQWSEGLTTFADEGGVFGSSKYTDNFEVITSSSTAVTQLDLQINNAEVSDEGTYTCEMTPGLGTAAFKVEIEGEVPTITIDGDSSGNPVRLTAGVQSTLRCTARNFRPAVNLQWFKDNEQITTDITEDLPTDNGDDTSTTSGTWTIIPTIPDDGDRLECRTTGQEVATAKTGVLTLNVQYVPVVTVGYSGGQITCSSDANPLATTHQIIQNGTDILKTFPNSPGSVEFTPKYCAEISCNATNTIGTGTDTFAQQICPVIPDETTTEMPSTDYVEPTTPAPPKPSDKPTTPSAQGLGPAVLAVIIVLPVLAVLIAVIAILYCYTQKKFCFDSNKTSNGGSSPKKQPSIVNADMIRNQPEVRQSVHNYDDEPKKPRVPRSNSGKPAPEKEALKQSAPPTDNDHQAYPMDSYDGDPQQDRGQAGVNYADLQFQNRDRATNGHGKIHQSDEEPTQYASILV